MPCYCGGGSGAEYKRHHGECWIMQAANPAPALQHQPQHQPQHAQHAQQQSQLAQQHSQHAQQPQAYAHWHRVSSWGSPWSNSPPAVPIAPHATSVAPPRPPPAPELPSAAATATIDLTGEDDSSPSPSGSSDYHIVSVDAQQPVPASSPSHRQESAGHLCVRQGHRAAGNDAAGPNRHRLDPSNIQEGPRREVHPSRQSMHPIRNHEGASRQSVGLSSSAAGFWSDRDNVAAPSAPGQDSAAQSEALQRPAKRRRWDVMPDHLLTATASPASRPQAEDRPDHRPRSQTQQVWAQSEDRPEHRPYTEAEQPQQSLQLSNRTPAPHAGHAEQSQTLQDSDPEASESGRHHHRRRHSRSHQSQNKRRASGSQHAQHNRSGRHSRAKLEGLRQHGVDPHKAQSPDQHAPAGSTAEHQGRMCDGGCDEQQPDLLGCDRWQLWQPGMEM